MGRKPTPNGASQKLAEQTLFVQSSFCEDKSAVSPSRARNKAKTSEALHLALKNAVEKGTLPSVSSVAAEVGVSPSLIHHVYPDIAEKIRALSGKSSRQQRDKKGRETAAAKETIRELRNELKGIKEDMAKLASINLNLYDEIAVLKAKNEGKVQSILKN